MKVTVYLMELPSTSLATLTSSTDAISWSRVLTVAADASKAMSRE